MMMENSSVNQYKAGLEQRQALAGLQRPASGKLKSNIVLIGMMGVGKTAVGRTLARELDYDFYDTDSQLEQVTGLKASGILSKYGPIRFHSEEALLVKKLAGLERVVVSTGVDMVLAPQNVEVLRELGYLVWLKASPQTIFNRVKRKTNRPFLPKGATIDDVARLLAEREPAYCQAADFTVEVDGNDLDFVVRQIKKQLNFLFSCIK